MKIRIGFVSNSSSSSFICQNCGNNIVIGRNEEIYCYECENGHNFCEYCFDDLKTDVDEYEIKKHNCPICNGTEITNGQIDGNYDLAVKFLLRLIGYNKQEWYDIIKQRYKNIAELEQDMQK